MSNSRQYLVQTYLDQQAQEDAVTTRARDAAREEGLSPVAPSVGAQLAVIAAACEARNMLEVGTGTGVSGLWLLRGAPQATLTSIDREAEYQRHAREAFQARGIPANHARLIAADARDVLPRMNEGSYDIVFIDAEPERTLEYVESALRLVRVGGSVLVHGVLFGGALADPARRERPIQDVRALLHELADSAAVVTALNPLGEGLLQMTRLPE